MQVVKEVVADVGDGERGGDDYTLIFVDLVDSNMILYALVMLYVCVDSTCPPALLQLKSCFTHDDLLKIHQAHYNTVV